MSTSMRNAVLLPSSCSKTASPLMVCLLAVSLVTVPLLSSAQVQPRFAEPVTARHAPVVQPITSPGVEPRRTEQVQDTSVPEGSTRNWTWQQLPSTHATDAGLAGGGSQLTNIRCAGVTCRLIERGGPVGDGWTVSAAGGFPTDGPNGVVAALASMDTREIIESRQKGNMADGSFSDLIPIGRLAAGNYLVSYRRISTNRVLGAVMFTVVAGQAAVSPQAVKPAVQSGGFAGIWYANSAFGTQNATGTIELTPDGRYVRRTGSVQFSGRYVVRGDEIRFDGKLKEWDGGRASINDSVIRFAWREGGVNMEFRFRKG